MTDKDTDSSDAEFWCGTCTGLPEDDEVATMDDIDRSRDPGELPAPWSWAAAVVRKVRTFGSTPGLDGDVFRCLHCGHHGPFPVHTWAEGEPVYECPGCEVTAPENEFDLRDIETAIRIAGSERSDGE